MTNRMTPEREAQIRREVATWVAGGRRERDAGCRFPEEEELLDELDAERAQHGADLEQAWGVIANAHRDGNGWLGAPADWQEAAARFRQNVWLQYRRSTLEGSPSGRCAVCKRAPGCPELRGMCSSCHTGWRVNFIVEGGEFTGRDEAALAQSIRGAAAKSTAVEKRRLRIDRGWQAVRAVACFAVLYETSRQGL